MSEVYGFSKGRLLLNSISSFWSLVFKDAELIKSFVGGIEKTLSQAYFNLLEIILKKSVQDIPIFHREKWTLLIFNESDRNKNSESLLKYGQGVVYGGQPADSDFIPGATFQYGGFAEGLTSSFKLPDKMVDIESFLMNRIYEPSLVLTNGVDFFIRNGIIFFKENPFENDLLPKKEIIDQDGNVVDRQVAIWALNSDFDFQFLFKNYGSIIDIFLESNENYKQFLQTAWRLFTTGPRINNLLSTLNAFLGLPVIIEEKEIVQTLLITDTEQRIVTDQHVYILAPNVDLRSDLTPGLELKAFDYLTDAIVILDTVRNPRWWTNFAYLPIPNEILSHEYFDSLKVFNELVTTDVNFGASAPLKVIGEMTEDKQQLFNDFPIPWGAGWNWGDTKLSFRALDLLMDNFWKSHLFFLQIKANQVLPGRLNQNLIDLLNEALPAYVHFINITDVEFNEDFNTETDTEDDSDFEKAHANTEEYTANVDWEDGFQGVLRWGDGVPFGEFEWGSRGFIGSFKMFLRENRCT